MRIRLSAWLILVILSVGVSAGCRTFFHRMPFRDYEKIPFSEEQWKNGDAIERGRMRNGMIDAVTGKNREEVLRMLGPPDEITVRDGVERLWYYTDHVGRRQLLSTPISFDANGRAKVGV